MKMEVTQPLSFRAQMVSRRTYQRPLNEEGTEFETWEQMVDRCMVHQEWLWTRAQNELLSDPQRAEIEELRQLMYRRQALLSGRTMWLGGTDIAREREASMFNPLAKGTMVMTREWGLVPVETLDKQHFHTVGSDGELYAAYGSYSGVQKTKTIELYRGRQTVKISASENHRWWTTDGDRVTTNDLEPGTLIPSVLPAAIEGDEEGFLHGFVYGDGTIANPEASTGGSYRVRICGAKTKYIPRLMRFVTSASYPPSAGGDPFLYFGSCAAFGQRLKKLPVVVSPSYIAGFVEGLLAADGSVDGKSFLGSKEAVDFIERYAHLVGKVTGSRSVATGPTNFGPRTAPLHKLIFTTTQEPFRVREVIEAGEQDVWCCNVPVEESFVLQHGVLTSNCAFSKVETVYDIVDAIWLLLQGCGVGFRPIVGSLTGFTKRIDSVEMIRSKATAKTGVDKNTETWDEETKTWTIKVGDSAEAWARFFGKLMAGKRPAKKLVIDFSAIRPAGLRLKGYGWLSSGDNSITVAVAGIVKVMNARAGALLTRIDILDVVNWLGTILSSRRSAEIAIVAYGEEEWEEFAAAKKDFWLSNIQREQSNNSLLFESQPERTELVDIFDRMIEAGGSEPGFINAVSARTRAPWFSGGNPCVRADTQLLTSGGYCSIGALRNTDVKVWNGRNWSPTTVRSTGVNPLLRVELSDGTYLECTPYHEWVTPEGKVKAIDLIEGTRLQKFAMPTITPVTELDRMAYSQGFYSGDGNKGMDWSWVYEPKYGVIPHLTGHCRPDTTAYKRRQWHHGPMADKTWVPLNSTDKYKVSWLAGLLDADGNVMRNPNSTALCLTSVDRNFLLRIRLMLTTLGIQAKVAPMLDEGFRPMPDGKGGSRDYFCAASFRLLINSTDVEILVEAGLDCKRLVIDKLSSQRDARRFVTVTEVIDLGIEEETFCFTEPELGQGTFNGIVTGQCFEILLANKGFCNLVTTNLKAFAGDREGLDRALYVIGRANYRQTCVDLRDGVLQEQWQLNNEHLRLCGMSLTGIAQRPDLKAYDYVQMRRTAIAATYSMADELGLPRPKNITTIKPEGTGSKCMDVTEGMHNPLGKYILNNINFSRHDPLVGVARAAGYKVFDNPTNSDNALVAFPVKYEGIKFTSVKGTQVCIETAVEQLERYKMLMVNWCDQNVSATISYNVTEKDAIVDWLLANWDIYVGVSFLFRNDPTKTAKDLGYLYLPQEVVTKEVYDEYVKGLASVDLNATNSHETINVDECVGGVCPVR